MKRKIPAETEDVAQRALLKLFEHASEFNPELDALSWALGITGYEIRTERKKISRNREDSSLMDWDQSLRDEGPSPEEQVIANEIFEEINQLVGELRPIDRDAIIALSNGKRPKIPGATFRKRVERALARIRVAWRTKHGPG